MGLRVHLQAVDAELAEVLGDGVGRARCSPVERLRVVALLVEDEDDAGAGGGAVEDGAGDRAPMDGSLEDVRHLRAERLVALLIHVEADAGRGLPLVGVPVVALEDVRRPPPLRLDRSRAQHLGEPGDAGDLDTLALRTGEASAERDLHGGPQAASSSEREW